MRGVKDNTRPTGCDSWAALQPLQGFIHREPVLQGGVVPHLEQGRAALVPGERVRLAGAAQGAAVAGQPQALNGRPAGRVEECAPAARGEVDVADFAFQTANEQPVAASVVGQGVDPSSPSTKRDSGL
jgi:hypothetical protein